ncbi:ParA family protein (plasmid) [Flavobacterium sp. CBA20B-1]|uniref:ParA family protein n=1 Tax=unclassified Flavobacterium TaxID=196869 RepID=UPI002225768E|nr:MULTISPECIES: ParA family protein [unclassified Flavobacterium]WCM43604.1 ParA family protein [Flavobacterium sp. CBA20B-1]
MTKIISVSNHKGGVGKTTSSVNIGAALNLLKKKVLLIDLDPQANLSQSLGISTENKTVYGSLRGEYPLTPFEYKKGFDVVPSTLDLSGAEIELASEPGREQILKELIEPIASKYDFILIDCPPSLGLLTLNSFVASNHIIVPIQAQYLALQGVVKLIEVIKKIQSRLNKNLQLTGLFVTQYDKRKVLNKNILESLDENFNKLLFKTQIRDNVSIAEAPVSKQDIISYNPKSYGSEDYKNLAKEIIKRLGK